MTPPQPSLSVTIGWHDQVIRYARFSLVTMQGTTIFPVRTSLTGKTHHFKTFFPTWSSEK